jgi:hypothetical protein
MTLEKLALIRALAAQPNRNPTPALLPLVRELADQGYVVEDKASGWMATAQGCSLIERMRTHPN